MCELRYYATGLFSGVFFLMTDLSGAVRLCRLYHRIYCEAVSLFVFIYHYSSDGMAQMTIVTDRSSEPFAVQAACV